MNSRKARATAIKSYAATNADIDLLADCKGLGAFPDARPTVGLYIGGTGNLTVKTSSGTTATYTSLPAGYHMDIDAIAIVGATSTVTNLVAEWG